MQREWRREKIANKRKHKGTREYSFWEIGRKTFYRGMKGNGVGTAEIRLDTKMSVGKIVIQRWEKDNCSDQQEREVTRKARNGESLMRAKDVR